MHIQGDITQTSHGNFQDGDVPAALNIFFEGAQQYDDDDGTVISNHKVLGRRIAIEYL